jgi:hypothetical protein
MSIDQYRQRIGLFHAKTKNVYPRRLKTDFSAVFLNLFLILIFSIAPLYIRLFHFFYQQMLPSIDGIFIKTINAICRKFTKFLLLSHGFVNFLQIALIVFMKMPSMLGSICW